MRIEDALELRDLRVEVVRLRGLLAQIEMELKHPQMDGSQVPRAIALAEQRRELGSEVGA
jgi:hypothetical protein